MNNKRLKQNEETIRREYFERPNRLGKRYCSKRLAKKKEKTNKNRIPYLVMYNRKLSMMYKIISKNWNVLEIYVEL